ncbi:MAG: hypothetical protein J6L62_02010 [Clostridia bacterium]|nr:hypothetical protein [Clostridia bacterium]
MKKVLSVIICITLILSCFAPSFASEPEEYPTIYVIGAHKNDIINAQGETVYPLSADFGGIIKETLGPCLKELAKGMITDDYTSYAEEFNASWSPIFKDLVLDKNGDVTNGSYTRFQTETAHLAGKTSGFGPWDCRFWYDWRESPIKTAHELKAHIDDVVELTGKDKVQLIGRCYGANVIAAYLELYKDHAKEYVSDISYYSSSVMGVDFMSALFSGQIKMENEAMDSFLDYYISEQGLIGDEVCAEFAMALVELMNQAKLLGITGDAFISFVNNFKDDLFPLIIRNTFGGWLSYWSMVTPELYEQARDYVFNTDEVRAEYAGFIEKADEYYYTVQVNVIDTMLEMKEAGINFYIFAKYNLPEFPLYEGATVQGDADTSVYRQSFGATCADYDEVLSAEYLATVTEENMKYISPDKKIDASTCMFPDTTWFVKDLHHNYFAPLEAPSVEIMRYDITVDSEKYPQYMMNVNNASLAPFEGTDEDFGKADENMIAAIVDFIKTFANLIVNLIKDELEFSFNIGALT